MPVATTNLLGRLGEEVFWHLLALIPSLIIFVIFLTNRSLQTTIAQLENLYNSKAGANFYSHKGQKKLKGQLFLDKFQEKVQHTFLDYISSGFELNFMVAVDFTASNGDPRVPQSLHYIDPSGRPNSYQQAILGVSEVLQFYDNDRRFPAWGFGAKIPRGSVSHCFNLNASTNDCEVVGVEGIMSAYSSTLYSVSLAGPTLFGPVISKAAEIASHSVQYGNNKYFVLLIITVCNIYPHVTSVQKFYPSIVVCRMELSPTSKKQKILL
uniref:Copine C-terminal domain-containing protein n=1 Tax=Aegilops tauschii subsp. strangulata TaxID=200361 RepID=A0A452YZ40_AEGTS